MSRHTAIILVFLFICPAALSAGPLSRFECEPATRSTAPPTKSDPKAEGLLQPKALKPTGGERLLSSVSLRLDVLDQADFVASNETRALPSNPDMEVPVVVFRPARDEALLKGSVSFNLAAFFDDVDALSSRYSTLQKNHKLFDLDKPDPVDTGDAFDYFARRRTGDRWGRLFSGLTLTGGLAERASKVTDPILPPEDEHEGVWGLTFDPTKLFVTDEQINTAIATTIAYSKAYQNPDVLAHLPDCPKNVQACVKQLSAEGASPLWMTLLPTFEVKSVDQFDFFTLNERFRSTSLLEDSIETYTFKWDLARSFATSKKREARVKAAATLTALQKKRRNRVAIASINAQFRSGKLELVYLPLKVENAIEKATLEVWDRTGASFCHKAKKGEVFPGLAIDGTRITGYPTETGSCTFLLRAKDVVGRTSSTMSCTIEISR